MAWRYGRPEAKAGLAEHEHDFKERWNEHSKMCPRVGRFMITYPTLREGSKSTEVHTRFSNFLPTDQDIHYFG